MDVTTVKGSGSWGDDAALQQAVFPHDTELEPDSQIVLFEGGGMTESN